MHRRSILRSVACDLKKLPIGALEAFVLSQVHGHSAAEDVAEAVGLELGELPADRRATRGSGGSFGRRREGEDEATGAPGTAPYVVAASAFEGGQGREAPRAERRRPGAAQARRPAVARHRPARGLRPVADRRRDDDGGPGGDHGPVHPGSERRPARARGRGRGGPRRRRAALVEGSPVCRAGRPAEPESPPSSRHKSAAAHGRSSRTLRAAAPVEPEKPQSSHPRSAAPHGRSSRAFRAAARVEPESLPLAQAPRVAQAPRFTQTPGVREAQVRREARAGRGGSVRPAGG